MGQDSTENNNSDTCNRKRVRDDDSEVNSPESKLIRLDSSNSHSNSPDLVTDRIDSGKNVKNEVESDDSGVNSPEAKRIQDDLLNIFDESDEPMIQGLDSVIRSFEEEILVPFSGDDGMLSNGSGSQPDLGYLLEASDDELGLPPTFSGEEEKVVGELDPESSGSGATTGLGEMIGLGDDMPSYDSFDFGIGGEQDGNNYNTSYNESGDFVTLGGLFDYAEDNYAPADMSAVQWQPESLSAL